MLPQTLVKETDEPHSEAGRTHFALTNSSGIMSCASLCGSLEMTAAEMLNCNTLRRGQRPSGLVVYWNGSSWLREE